MSSIGPLFRAERIKLRKSWAMLAAVLAPICQTAFLGLVFWFSGTRVQPFKPGFRFWLELNCLAWNLVVMPAAAALVCELSWDQEREARAWNLLLVHPVSRRAHYLVKFLGHLSLLLLAQVLLISMLVLVGGLLSLAPELLMGKLPLALLFRFAAYSVLALVAVTAFQTWLAMHFPGLWIALAAAMAGSWLTAHWAGGSALIQFLPWGLAGQLTTVFDRWRPLHWGYAPGSLVAAVVLLLLGVADWVHHCETGA